MADEQADNLIPGLGPQEALKPEDLALSAGAVPPRPASGPPLRRPIPKTHTPPASALRQTRGPRKGLLIGAGLTAVVAALFAVPALLPEQPITMARHEAQPPITPPTPTPPPADATPLPLDQYEEERTDQTGPSKRKKEREEQEKKKAPQGEHQEDRADLPQVTPLSAVNETAKRSRKPETRQGARSRKKRPKPHHVPRRTRHLPRQAHQHTSRGWQQPQHWQKPAEAVEPEAPAGRSETSSATEAASRPKPSGGVCAGLYPNDESFRNACSFGLDIGQEAAKTVLSK